jgi:hypothetical protein
MLASTDVFDLCRELGLEVDAVGPGIGTSADSPEQLWSPIQPAGAVTYEGGAIRSCRDERRSVDGKRRCRGLV